MIYVKKLGLISLSVIILFFLNTLYFSDYKFSSESEFDDIYIIRILKEAFKEYYASVLWVRIDEFYHVKHNFREDIYKQISMLEMFSRLSSHNHIGAIYLSYMYSKNLKDYDKAISVLNRFIDNNPKHPLIHKVLGEIGFINLFFKKDYNSAEESLLLAFNLSKTLPVKKDDPLEYLFYGNYLRMLRMVYKNLGNREYFDFYDNLIKDMKERFDFKDNDFHKQHPVYFVEAGEHNVFHKHDNNRHHQNHKHDHFDSEFLWQKNFLNLYIFAVFISIIILIKIVRSKKKQ